MTLGIALKNKNYFSLPCFAASYLAWHRTSPPLCRIFGLLFGDVKQSSRDSRSLSWCQMLSRCSVSGYDSHFKEPLQDYFTNFINIYMVCSREATVLINKLLTRGTTAIQELKNQIVIIVIAGYLELMENFSTCHRIMVSQSSLYWQNV